MLVLPLMESNRGKTADQPRAVNDPVQRREPEDCNHQHYANDTARNRWHKTHTEDIEIQRVYTSGGCLVRKQPRIMDVCRTRTAKLTAIGGIRESGTHLV